MRDATGAAPQAPVPSLSEEFERWAVAIFPRVLERLSKLQPLALLFSLSIVVATFSRQASQTAFVYGMAAAFSFGASLIASVFAMFVISVPELHDPAKPEGAMVYVFVYVSTTAGFVSLGGLLLTFSREMPELGRVLTFLFGVVFAISFAELSLVITLRLTKVRTRLSKTLYSALKYLTVGGAATLVSGPFFYLLGAPASEAGIVLFLFGLFLLLVLAFVTLRLERKYGAATPKGRS